MDEFSTHQPNFVRSVEEVREQLDHLRRLLTLAISLDQGDFVSEMEIFNLRREEAILVDELKAAHLKAGATAAQVVFNGPSIVDHKIDAKFLGSFVINYQNLINATAEYLEGIYQKAGTFPVRIVRANQFSVSSTMPTSFGVNFEPAPNAAPVQMSLLGDTGEEPIISPGMNSYDVAELVSTFFDGEASHDQMEDVISHPAVRTYYGRLVNLLTANNITLEYRVPGSPKATRMGSLQAEARKLWMKSGREETSSVSVTGILNATHARLRTFEIDADDGRRFSGRTTDAAAIWLKRIPVESRVKAEIQEKITRHEATSTGVKTEYLLRRIFPEGWTTDVDETDTVSEDIADGENESQDT